MRRGVLVLRPVIALTLGLPAPAYAMLHDNALGNRYPDLLADVRSVRRLEHFIE